MARSSLEKLRIIVSGMVARYPLGGVAWDYLQYVIGFANLGHDVYYHEDTWSWPYDPVRETQSSIGVYSAEMLGSFFCRYAPGLVGRWHYDHLHKRSYGMTRDVFARVAATADVFVNVSGASAIPDTLKPGCIKIFLDSDPGYNQIMLIEKFSWSENVDRWCEQVSDHDRHFTYAENIAYDDCLVPTAGYSWIPTRMPIVVDLWAHRSSRVPPKSAPWTTVMSWNTFSGPLKYRDIEYKGKETQFEKIIDLPIRSPHPFVIAVGGKNVPLRRLREHRWNPVDGPKSTLTAELYQDFIGDSRGEVSTAKDIYVSLRSGWFSCRSACYLAAGRPVVVEDTGFSKLLPTGLGLVAFRNLEEAIDGISAVSANYDAHAIAALEIAREHFSSERVLSDLLQRAFSTSQACEKSLET